MRSTMDEVDVALIDALQVNPRASFTDLGRALDVSAVTAARRWTRLHGAGQAWVSAAIGPRMPVCLGLAEAQCAPAAILSVATAWSHVPQAFSVHLTTGTHNAYALVAAADATALFSVFTDVLAATPGVQSFRSAVIPQLFSDTSWRLGALSSRQAQEVPATPDGGHLHTLDGRDQRLFLALQDDGRLSHRRLAAHLDWPESAVARRLRALQGSGLVRFRTDFARPEAGWPTNIALTIRLGHHHSATVGSALAGWPEIRVCAALIGEHADIFATVQVHRTTDLDAITARLYQQFPGTDVVSVRAALRGVKSCGRLLDSSGQAAGVVPVNPWAPLGS